MRRAMLFALVLTGCGKPEDSDTDPIDTVDTFEPCGEVEIHKEGPDAPVVGDKWTVSLYCDDAFMTGPYVVRFTDNAEFAQIEDTTITFTTAGTAHLRVQAGSERAEQDVTVLAE
jgi:hypothetical protein